jgi:hypothetical protein
MNHFFSIASSIVLDIAFLAMFIAIILWVVFGQVTVRRLRKNPEVKNHLGLEFYSGWDIMSVAQTLSLPKWIVRRRGTFYGLLPDHNLLYTHTTKLDRILGRIFYWTLIFAISGIFLCGFIPWIFS